MPQWKHFTVLEVINPFFDDNPAKESWDEMPEIIQERLEKTMSLVDAIREEYDDKLRLNSTWRLHDRKGRAHTEGHAVDFQPVKPDKDFGFKVIDFVKNLISINYSSIGINLFSINNIQHIRVFWECNKEGSFGWIHTDTNYNPKNSNKFAEYFVGYPDKTGKMVYALYEGKAPWEYVKGR